MRKHGTDVAGVGLPAGTKIGKYEILERYAMGGQAVVYKAYDSLLDRNVAIKQISTHLAEDAQFMERFRKEAQILAKLGAEQPCIVTIHDLIEDEHGLFIVMEFVAGHSLATIMADTNGPTETKAALQILWRLAGALHAVHSAGIVHRDIKPGNVIIGEGLWPTIMDFGVAASVTGQTSMVLGTTRYMAPELFNGSMVDGRADMYSLGFVMYELLLGKPKFDEMFADVVRDPRSATMRWMKWHGNAAVQAPLLHEVNSSIPVALSYIVARMIAKDPEERFESMEELGKAIKGAFSPRGRGGGKAVIIAPPASMMRGAGIAAGEGGQDELEIDTDDGVSLDPEPTVRLPKSTLSLKTKLILLGVALTSLLVVFIVYSAKQAEKRAAFEARVNRLYKPIAESYRNEEWQATVDNYALMVKAAKAEGGAPIAETLQLAKGRTLQRLSNGHLAVNEQEMNWAGAFKAAEEAKTSLEDLEERFAADVADSKAFDLWINNMSEDIKDFRRKYLKVRTFVEFDRRITQAIAKGEYQFALEQMEPEQLKARELILGDEERAKLAKYRKTIKEHMFMDAFRKIASGAEALKARGERDKAKIEFTKALEMIRSDEAVAILPEADRKSIEQQLTTKIAAIDDVQKVATLKRNLAVAVKNGDPAAIVRAIDILVAHRPGHPDNKALIKQKNDIIVNEDRKKLLADAKDGRPSRIIPKLKAWLAKHPGDAAVKARLDELEQGLDLAARVRAAKNAYSMRKWADAIPLLKALYKYNAADTGMERQQLRDMVAECEIQILWGEAEALREAKKYAEAIRKYEEVLQRRPEWREKIMRLVDGMTQTLKYDSSMAAAKDAFARKQYPQAITHAKIAKEIRPTSVEAIMIITNSRYEQQMAQGRAREEQKDYKGALAYYTIAYGIKKAPEAKQKMEDMKSKIAGGTP